MRVAGGLAAVLVFMTGGLAAPPPTTTVAAFDEMSATRRSIRFGAAEGALAVDVQSARYGCWFGGEDGRRSRGVFLVSRDGHPVAVTPVDPFGTEPSYPLRPLARPVWAAAHGMLPLADGPAAFEARLKREAWRSESRISLVCASRSTPGPRRRPTALEALVAAPFEVVGVVVFSPVILFGVPTENRSLVAAAGVGPAIAASLEPGKPVPGGLEAFVKAHRGLVRVHRDQGSSYAIVTVDLGGAPRYGIGAPRDAAFFGVRDGVVEWRGGRDMGIETTLCANDKGRFGGRPGCTKTGYYNPGV